MLCVSSKKFELVTNYIRIHYYKTLHRQTMTSQPRAQSDNYISSCIVLILMHILEMVECFLESILIVKVIISLDVDTFPLFD